MRARPGTPPAPAADAARPPARGAWNVLALLFLVTVVMSLTGTMLNIALPRVVEHFGATATQGTWMVVAYNMVNTSVLVLMGQLADSVDQRRMFLTGLGLFTASSLLLGWAPTPEVFVGLRMVQGVAGAVLLSNAGAMLASVFPPRRLNTAMGVYLAGFSVAQVAGPSVGGLVTTWYGWQWLFWANVPLGLVACAWAWRALRHLPAKTGSGPRVDVLGNLVILAGLGSLLTGISAVSGNGWADPLVIGGLAVFALLLPLLLVIERRVRHPAIDPDLFRKPAFSRAMLSGLLVATPRLSVMALIGLYFQGMHGETPLTAALKVTPMAIGLTAGSLLCGAVTRLVREHVAAIGAAAVSTLGMAVLIWAIGGRGAVSWILTGLTVLGLGNGVFLSLNSTMVMRSVPLAQAGNVNAIRVMVQSGGIALSSAISLTLAVIGLTPQAARFFFAGAAGALTPSDLDRLAVGHQLTFAVMTAMSLAGLLVCVRDLVASRRAS